MFQRSYITIFCMLLIFTSINCFTHEIDPSSSISKIENHKVYLKPGFIQIANNGIFINVEGQLTAIDHLEMDEHGVFFNSNKIGTSFCPACHLPLVFGFCMNPNCPSKG